MAIRILVAEHNIELRGRIREMLGSREGLDVVAQARDGQEAIQAAMQALPHIALISYDLPGINGSQTCEVLTALMPELMPILYTRSRSPEQVEVAMRSGARALVSEPFQANQLTALIMEMDAVRTRRQSQEILQWKDPLRFPRSICITGAKGGVGKTTLAVNLSAVLAQKFPERVALVDLYTQFGDIPTMLNMTPKLTISEIASLSHELDAELIQNCIMKHPSGLHVMVTSIAPRPLDALPPGFLDDLLYALKREYSYVVMDTPPVLHQMTLQVLSHADMVLLIANLFDLTTVTDTKKLYDTLLAEHLPKENIRIVLNRVAKANQLTGPDLEKLFDSSSVIRIPNDSRLVGSVNEGVPLVLSDDSSPFRRAIDDLARRVGPSRPNELPASNGSAKRGFPGFRLLRSHETH